MICQTAIGVKKMDFEKLKLHIGNKLWDKKSKKWLTLEKVIILEKDKTYVQFEELNNIHQLKEFDLRKGLYQ